MTDDDIFFQEKARKRQEKYEMEERLRMWNRPREDMECDDLKVRTSLCYSVLNNVHFQFH